MFKNEISRRSFTLGMPMFVAGCAAHPPKVVMQSDPAENYYKSMYSAIDGEPYPIPAVDLTQIDEQFLRREVDYSTNERPGTIIVNPTTRFLYLVQEGQKAMRYGVGVGKHEAFNFQGEAVIARKAEWPKWRPTANMVAREPDRYGPLKDGLPGGSGNPLGPRALYLYRNGGDTLYRLHGTVEPWTIGTMVSSGCVRLLNQDIIDLYRRVPVGTKAIVRAAEIATAA